MLFRTFLSIFLGTLATGPYAIASNCSENLDFSFRKLAENKQLKLCEAYSGKVLLVVNTASHCGFTPQLKGLEALYDQYRDRGLVVLGFPSNDFAQEPGSEQEIQRFCELNYGVDFPMFEKTRVQEGESHPFFDRLAAGGGGYPQWNFHKYLLNRNGEVVTAFPTRTSPDDPEVISAIEGLL
jgi:glutathione peroxidase